MALKKKRVSIDLAANPTWARQTKAQVSFYNFGNDKLFWGSFAFFLISLTFQILLLISSRKLLPPEVPIFYSMPWGEKILANPIFLWLLPIICLAIFLSNYLIIRFWTKEDKFLGGVLIVFSLLCSFTTLYTTLNIIILLV